MAEIVDLRGRDRVPAAPPILADPSGRRARMLARAGRVVAIVFVVWLAGLALAGLGILPAGDVPLGPAIAAQSPSRLDRVQAARQPTRADLAPALPATPGGSSGAAVAQTTLIATSPTAAGFGVRIPGAAGPGATVRNPGASPHRRGSGSGHVGPAVNPRLPAHGTGGSGGSGGGTSSGAGSSAGAAGGPGAAANGASASHHAATSMGSTTGKTTAPGQTTKQTTPAATSTTSHGSSSAAPGQVKQTTTTSTITPTPTTTSPGQSGSAPGRTVPHGGGHGNGN